MKWSIPARDKDPWYDDFVDLTGSQDTSASAAREDRNIIGLRGGTFGFTLSSGEVTWDDTIELLSAITGFLWQIPAGSVVLGEGELFYVVLPRYPSDNTSVSTAKASNISLVDGDSAFVLAIRRESKVYWRNGAVMEDGQSFEVFEASGGQGGGGGSTFGEVGQKIRNIITISTNEPTDQSTFSAIGAFALDPDDYEITGTAVEFRFLVTGSITNSVTTGSIQLFDLTGAAIVTTITFNGAPDLTPQKKISSLLALPSGERLYEVRIKVTGGTPPTDKLLASWTGFQIDNAFTSGT
jgi:hypothetical protein